MTDTRPHFYFDYEAEGLTSWDITGNKVCGENLDNSKHYLIIDHEDDTVYEIFNEPINFISSNFYAIVDIYEAIDPSYFEDLESVNVYSDLYNEINYLGQINNNINDDEIYVGELEEEPSTSSTTWTIGNKTVSSLFIGNKEVQSIVRTNDNVVLYEKDNNVTPVISEPNNISLSASKYILSKHDNDTCVLSATVTDANNNACSNQTITFKANNTVLGTATTDSNGVATYTYNSQGSGDVTITVECESLIETQTIEDCDVYYITSQISDFPSVSKGSDTFAVSNYSISLQNYSVEFKCSSGVQVTVGNQNDWVFACNIGMYNGSMSTHQSTGSVLTENGVFNSTNRVYRVEVEGTTIRVYNLNLLVKTYTNCKINYPTNLRAYPYTSRGNIQYIKVKPL